MNSRFLITTTAIALSLTLGGCDSLKKVIGGNKPAGQVVATVDGKEITALDLRQEMGGFASRDPAAMKAAQEQALQGLILKLLVVEQAKEQGLAKTAEFALQKRRAEETLLAQAYQRKIASAIAVPSKQDADRYISDNPEKFANRRVLVVDQIVVSANKLEPDRFRPLTTMEQVKSLLTSENIPFQETVATIDTLTVNEGLLVQIDKLPPGEIFVMPQRGGLLLNRIAEARSVPFLGDPAEAYAINVLRSQRAQEAVARQIELLRKSAEKTIIYNESYKPSPNSAKIPTKGAAASAAGTNAKTPTAALPAPAPSAAAPATKP